MDKQHDDDESVVTVMVCWFLGLETHSRFLFYIVCVAISHEFELELHMNISTSKCNEKGRTAGPIKLLQAMSPVQSNLIYCDS